MSELMPASITVGGYLQTQEMLEGLAQAILDDGAGPGWGETYDSTAEILDDIERAAAQKRPLTLYDVEASWGEFSEIEGFATDHHLCFIRDNSAVGEYEAETCYFDGNASDTQFISQSGEMLVPASALIAALESGKLQTFAERVRTRYKQEVPPLTLPSVRFQVEV